MLQVDWKLVQTIVPKFSRMKYTHQHLQVYLCICMSIGGFYVSLHLKMIIFDLRPHLQYATSGAASCWHTVGAL